MAVKKARKGVIKAPPPPPAAGADDLQQLHPDLEAVINGRKVVVREYGFVEGLELRPRLQPFLDELYQLAKEDAAPPLDHIVGIIGKHTDLLMPAVAQAAGIELEELRELKNQYEGLALIHKWWIANGPFLWRCVLERILSEAEVARLRAGVTSTSSSSAAASAAPSKSES